MASWVLAGTSGEGDKDPREEDMIRKGTSKRRGKSLLTSFEDDGRVHEGL